MSDNQPAFAYLLPTGRCNLHCQGCYATLESFGRNSAKGELTLAEYRVVIAELLDLGVRTFDISGGEPLLYPHLVEICEAIRQHRDARIWLVTNGTIGNSAKLVELSRWVNRIVFSLDAPTPLLHDELRGSQGAFDRTLATLRAARELPFEEVAINFVVCRRNLASAVDMVRLAQTERVDRLSLLTFRDVSENGVLFHLIPSLADLRTMWQDTAELLAGSTWPRQLDIVAPAFLFPDTTQFRRSLTPHIRRRVVLHHPHLRGHSAYRETIVVKPFGTLSGDTAMVNNGLFDLGSARDGVAGVWRSEAPRWRARLAERAAVLKAQGPCADCPRWHYCRGGCPAAALHQWNDLAKHDRTCDPFRAEGDF